VLKTEIQHADSINLHMLREKTLEGVQGGTTPPSEVAYRARGQHNMTFAVALFCIIISAKSLSVVS
jgi:hypothetical protein